MLLARTDRGLVRAENEQIQLVFALLWQLEHHYSGQPTLWLFTKINPSSRIIALLSLFQWDKIWTRYIWNIVPGHVASSGHLWGDISIIVRDIYIGGDWPVLDLAPGASWCMINVVTMRVSWSWPLGINHGLIWFYTFRWCDESEARDCVTWDTCRSSQDTISHPSRSAIYITSQHTQTIGLAKRFIERKKTNQRETIGRVSGYIHRVCLEM